MKKNIKKEIISFIAGLALASSVAVYATIVTSADKVSYNSTTVDLALNDLYNRTDLTSQTPANATAADILSGKTAWVNGKQINGAFAYGKGYTWKTDTFSTTANETKNIVLGFTPTYFYITGVNASNGGGSSFIYDSSVSTTHFTTIGATTSTVKIGEGSGSTIKSIGTTVVFQASSANVTKNWAWVAIK